MEAIHIFTRSKEGIDLTHIFELTDAITTVKFEPNHQLMIAGDAAGHCSIWRLSDSELIYSLKGLSAPVLSTAFSRDGNYVITVDGSNTMTSWKTPSTQPNWQKELMLPTSGVMITGDSGEYKACLILDDIFSRVAWVIDPYTQELQQFNLSTGPKITVIEAHRSSLFLGDASGQINLWDQKDTSRQNIFKSHTEGILSLASSQRGDKLYSLGQDRRLLTWNVSSAQITDSLTFNENISDLAIDFSANQVLSISSSGKLMRHDLKDLAKSRILAEIETECTEVYIYNSGKRILVRDKDDHFHLFDGNAKPIRSFSIEEKPTAIACDYFADNIVIATSAGKIMIANADGYFYHHLFMPGRSIAHSIDIAGEWIVTTSDNEVQWWLNNRDGIE